MKVIFLDHYGVMTLSKENIKRKIGELPSIEELKLTKHLDNFDKYCIDILNSILVSTKSEIVIISDCKNIISFEDICIFYKEQGILKQPISYTEEYKSKDIINARKNEVINFLNNNRNIKKYVCVDDIYLDIKNFVWCENPNKGISEIGIKEKIIKYLN